MTIPEFSDPIAQALENAREQERLDVLARLRARSIGELDAALTGEQLRGTEISIVIQCCADIALDAILQCVKKLRPQQREMASLTMLQGVANAARDYLDAQDDIDVIAAQIDREAP